MALLAGKHHDLVGIVNRLHGRHGLVAKRNFAGRNDKVEPRGEQHAQDNGGNDEVYDAEAVDHNGVEHVLGGELGERQRKDDGENGAGDELESRVSLGGM